MCTDTIEKQILLRAPIDRVWRAISNSSEFGSWFGFKVEGPFVAGERVRVTCFPTTVHEGVAASQKPYEGTPYELIVEKIEPESAFSFRWHPFAFDTSVDYSAEPTTLVTFVLEQKEDGVLLTDTESGFDQIPLERRATAFGANEYCWIIGVMLVEAYLAKSP